MLKELGNWTSIIKKIGIVIVICILIIIGFKLAIFYMPFLIAFLIATILEPLIRILMRKLKITRKASSIIVFIITLGIIIGLIVWGTVTVISESNNLLQNSNNYYEKAQEKIKAIGEKINSQQLKIPSEMIDKLNETSLNLLEQISNKIQQFLTGFLTGLTKIPTFAICFVVTILSVYFICTDRIYMIDELEYHLPEKWMQKISKHLRDILKTLGGYLKAQGILILISFIICLIGLYILYFLGLNVGFPLITALLIAFVDALPILGSGTVMVPWGIISGINGDLKLGISIIVLWIIMSVVRQFIEPKIVSRKYWNSSNIYNNCNVYRI